MTEKEMMDKASKFVDSMKTDPHGRPHEKHLGIVRGPGDLEYAVTITAHPVTG